MRKVLFIAMTLIFVWSCSKDQEELIPSNSNDFFAYSSIDNPVLDNVVSFLQKRNEIENFTSDFSVIYGDVIWDENITIKNEEGFVMLIPTLLNQEVEGIWLFDCFKGTINYAVIVNDQEVRQDKNMDYNFAYFEQTILNKNDKYKFIQPNEKDYNIRTKEGAHIIEHCNMIFTGNNTIGFELTDIHCWDEHVPGTVSGRYIYDYYTDQVGGGTGDMSGGGGGGTSPNPLPKIDNESKYKDVDKALAFLKQRGALELALTFEELAFDPNLSREDRIKLYDAILDAYQQLQGQYLMSIFSPETVGTVLSFALIPNITKTTQAKVLQIASKAKNKVFQRMAIGLRDALRGKGNFGIGKATRQEAIEMGKAWVGEGYKVSSKNPNIWISKDGMRQFRGTTFKKSLNKFQANFESKVKITDKGWPNNGHLDITN